jgi:hypothetical protein
MRPMSRARNEPLVSPRLPLTRCDGPERASASEASASARVEALLDEALAETFPASDPVALPWPNAATPNDI